MFGLENGNYLATIIVAGASIIGSVFYAGFYFNKRIKEACQEEMKELTDEMIQLTQRVDLIEKQYLSKQEYDKDMQEVKTCIKEMHSDVKTGLIQISNRIDNIMLSQVPNAT